MSHIVRTVAIVAMLCTVTSALADVGLNVGEKS
jgi:hypothetical protein